MHGHETSVMSGVIRRGVRGYNALCSVCNKRCKLDYVFSFSSCPRCKAKPSSGVPGILAENNSWAVYYNFRKAEASLKTGNFQIIRNGRIGRFKNLQDAKAFLIKADKEMEQHSYITNSRGNRKWSFEGVSYKIPSQPSIYGIGMISTDMIPRVEHPVIYTLWLGALRNCMTNPETTTIADEWKIFEQFLEWAMEADNYDLVCKAEGRLVRTGDGGINGNPLIHYSPETCRFAATYEEADSAVEDTLRITNKTGLLNICYNKQSDRLCVTICSKRTVVFYGHFLTTEREQAIARRDAARRYLAKYKTLATLNELISWRCLGEP